MSEQDSRDIESAIAKWNRTKDKVSLGQTWAACGWNNPGGSTVPVGANGIVAYLSVQIKYCFHSYSTSESFAAGQFPHKAQWQ
jgi:hypothetical protein